jgi:hypothetical protein
MCLPRFAFNSSVHYQEVTEGLYDDGFVNITSIDVSPVVIHQLNDRYSDRVELECTICPFRNAGCLNCSDVSCDDGCN